MVKITPLMSLAKCCVLPQASSGNPKWWTLNTYPLDIATSGENVKEAGVKALQLKHRLHLAVRRLINGSDLLASFVYDMKNPKNAQLWLSFPTVAGC